MPPYTRPVATVMPIAIASAIARHDMTTVMPAARISEGRYFRTSSTKHAREKLRLVFVPNVPLAINPLERAVAHARFQDLVDPVAQRGVARREHGDVVTGRDGPVVMRVQPTRPPHRARGDDVVEQHGVEAPRHDVFVRMHV